jgi:hypothetical protein
MANDEQGIEPVDFFSPQQQSHQQKGATQLLSGDAKVTTD